MRISGRIGVVEGVGGKVPQAATAGVSIVWRHRGLWAAAGLFAVFASAAPCQTFVRKIPDRPAVYAANDVAVDPGGNIWVVTDLDELVKLSAAGQELLRVARQFRSGSGVNALFRPFSITMGLANDLYVTTQNSIVRFDLAGNYLGSFGSTGAGNGQFNGLGRIATAANGDLLAVDIGGHRVQRFDPQGNFLLAFGSAGAGPGQFDFVDGSFPMFATGIAEDTNGNIHVVDRGNQRVQKFDPAGTFLSAFPTAFTGPFTFGFTDLAIDALGRLLVSGNGPAFQVFDAAGALQQTVPFTTYAGFSGAPKGIALDAQGNVFTAESPGRVLKLSPSLTTTLAGYGTGWTTSTDGEFFLAGAVLWDANGDLRVADQTVRLQRFAANGAFVSRQNWAIPPGSGVNGQAMARDSAGFLYTAGSSAGIQRVMKWTAAGAFVQTIGNFASNAVRGIAFDAADNLFVSNEVSVRRLDAAGNTVLMIPTSDANGIAVDAGGRILIAGGPGVSIHDSAGTLLSSIAVPGARSVLVDAAGRIYVGTFGGGVYVFNAAGVRLVRFGARGSGTGEFQVCSGMALQSGLLAIADSGVNRVQVYDVSMLDQVTPVVTITVPVVTNADDGAVVTTNTIAVTAQVADDSATTVTSSPVGVFALLPAGGGNANGTVTYPSPVDASFTLAITANDASGNSGGTSIRVTRDTAPPVFLTVSPAEGTVFGASAVTMSVNVSDLTSKTLTVSHGGGTFTQAGAAILSRSIPITLQNGSNAIVLEATDAAGHITTVTRTLTADLSAPIVEFLGLGGPTDPDCFGLGQSPLAVTVRVTDLSATTLSSTPAGISGSLPAGGGTRTGSISLVEGANTIVATASDQYGRQSSAVTQVVYDLTAPTVAFDAPTASQVSKGTVHVVVQADDLFADNTPGCGITSVAIRIDATLVETLPGNDDGIYELDLDTTVHADGSHTLVATAIDGVGNSRSANVTFTVDNTAPLLAITAPSDLAFVSGDDRPFTATASDANGIVSVRMAVAGGAPNDTDGSATFDPPVANAAVASVYDTTPFADGALLLRVTARDAAGNESTAEVTVTVDNTAPDKTLVSPTDGATVTGVVAIVATANDPNLTSLVIKVDGNIVGSTSSGSLTVPFDTTAHGAGAMTIEVVVTDAANNTSRCTATVYVVNLVYDFDPDTLSLKNKGQGVVTAHLEGQTVGNLLPIASHRIELRVAGGNAVSALAAGGVGDADADLVPDLTIRFDRSLLIASIRAGILGGLLPADGLIDIELWIDGGLVGASRVRVKS